MTLSYTEFLKRTPSVKVQKYGLGGGLYDGIEPEHKGGGNTCLGETPNTK